MTNVRVEPNPLIMLPFAALLLPIALAPLDPPSPLGTAVSQVLSRPRGHHFFLLCFRPPFWNSGAPCHARIREFHGCGWLVFRRGRRHSSAGARPGKTRSKYAFSGRRRAARKHHRHDRRVDVADPPVDRDEPKSLRWNTYRVFHFHGEQHRRRAPPGGPAVVLDNAAQMSEFIWAPLVSAH